MVLCSQLDEVLIRQIEYGSMNIGGLADLNVSQGLRIIAQTILVKKIAIHGFVEQLPVESLQLQRIVMHQL